MKSILGMAIVAVAALAMIAITGTPAEACGGRQARKERREHRHEARHSASGCEIQAAACCAPSVQVAPLQVAPLQAPTLPTGPLVKAVTAPPCAPCAGPAISVGAAAAISGCNSHPVARAIFHRRR